MFDVLRDPLWNGVAAISAFLSLMVYIIVERGRLWRSLKQAVAKTPTIPLSRISAASTFKEAASIGVLMGVVLPFYVALAGWHTVHEPLMKFTCYLIPFVVILHLLGPLEDMRRGSAYVLGFVLPTITTTTLGILILRRVAPQAWSAFLLAYRDLLLVCFPIEVTQTPTIQHSLLLWLVSP